MPANNSCSTVYVYSLLCLFISQYSNNLHIISMAETQTGAEKEGGSQTGGTAPCLPLELPPRRTLTV